MVRRWCLATVLTAAAALAGCAYPAEPYYGPPSYYDYGYGPGYNAYYPPTVIYRSGPSWYYDPPRHRHPPEPKPIIVRPPPPQQSPPPRHDADGRHDHRRGGDDNGRRWNGQRPPDGGRM